MLAMPPSSGDRYIAAKAEVTYPSIQLNSGIGVQRQTTTMNDINRFDTKNVRE